MIASPSSPPPVATDAEPRAAASLRRRLREETRASHERLDGSFGGLERNGDLRDYGRFLRVNEACLAGAGAALEASGLLLRLPEVSTSARQAAASADLKAMDLRPIAPPLFPLPRPNLAEAIGIAYVLEGSRLGARQILKRLRNREQLESGGKFTTLFLEAAGEPDRFRSFMEAAEAIATTTHARDLAVSAADRTFQYFIGAVRITENASSNGE
ncbi:biliverdin-producing heme oxygenase [Aureimonas psammosilenae]|uniref:biliverdin-producing heme oxygenase n=1 Tax=Aureimonas psammosilenae TaxID=2495496 RepID=UPI001260D05B|nr:biliverdin-producing heme oxygenase [Aureimonas psammosilenae]